MSGRSRKKGGRPEAALSLGRKRPRRAYTGVNPHRSKIMLRCNNCKQVSAVIVRYRSGAEGARLRRLVLAPLEIRTMRASGGEGYVALAMG
jgi:hypothetical protein